MFKFNGKTPKKIIFNGSKVSNIIYRTVKVWTDKILTTITNGNIVNNRHILLEDSVGENIVDYKLYSHTYYNGTPTPETPVALNTSGDYDETTGKYKFPIISSSNNVFKMDLMPVISGDYYTRNGDNITIDLTNETSANSTVVDITFGTVCPELKVGDKIVWYCESSSSNKNVWLSNGFYLELGKAYTVTDNMLTSKIHLYGKLGEKHTISKIRVFNVVKEYNIYLDEPLRRIDLDAYADYIDFANQKVVRNCGSWILTGYESGWYNNTNYTNDKVLCLTTSKITSCGVNYHPSYTGGFCNKFAYSASSAIANKFRFSSSVYLFITLDKTKYPEFNDDVRDNVLAGTEIIYIRKTPVEEPIELPVIETEEGENLFSYPLTNPVKTCEVCYYKYIE